MSTENNTASKSEPSSLVTLLGTEEISVTKRDGTVETVSVRLLPISAYPAMLAQLDDEIAMVEFYCSKPKGWAETLTLESFEQVILAGEKLNMDFFSRWAQRRIARQERLVPGITDKITSGALALPTSSPKPPSRVATR